MDDSVIPQSSASAPAPITPRAVGTFGMKTAAKKPEMKVVPPSSTRIGGEIFNARQLLQEQAAQVTELKTRIEEKDREIQRLATFKDSIDKAKVVTMQTQAANEDFIYPKLEATTGGPVFPRPVLRPHGKISGIILPFKKPEGGGKPVAETKLETPQIITPVIAQIKPTPETEGAPPVNLNTEIIPDKEATPDIVMEETVPAPSPAQTPIVNQEPLKKEGGVEKEERIKAVSLLLSTRASSANDAWYKIAGPTVKDGQIYMVPENASSEVGAAASKEQPGGGKENNWKDLMSPEMTDFTSDLLSTGKEELVAKYVKSFIDPSNSSAQEINLNRLLNTIPVNDILTAEDIPEMTVEQRLESCKFIKKIETVAQATRMSPGSEVANKEYIYVTPTIKLGEYIDKVKALAVVADKK